MQKKLETFAKLFDEGIPYRDAALQSGLAQSDTLAEYWNILQMEKAIRLSSEYFDKMIARAA